MDRLTSAVVADTTTIATFTANGYNSLEYTWVTGDAFRLGNLVLPYKVAPRSLSVSRVQVVDGDGDIAGGSIGVTLTPPQRPRPSRSPTTRLVTATIAGGSILYTFQFSETVTGFDAADITVVNGTKGAFTAVDGDTYTLVVTPMADFQGILAVGVAAGVAFDAAVNPNTAADLSVQAVDTLAPVASIILDAITADNIVNAAEAAGTVAVTGTVGGDVQVGDTVTLTVNGNSSYIGLVQAGLTFSIDVAGSDLAADTNVHASVNTTDAAGNAATATDDQAYTVDTVAPAASITLDAITGDNIINAAEAADTTVAISGTVGGDVQVGDTVTLTVNGNSSYTGLVQAGLTFSIRSRAAILRSDSDVHASVTATDAAGNTTTATDDQAYTVDTVAPSVAITDDEAGTANIAGGSIIYTFTFSQPVNGFTVGDVVVVGGTKAAAFASGADGSSVYTLEITPNAGFQGILTVNVAAGVATDLAGNPNTAAPQSVQAVDTLAPLVVITDDEPGTANIAGGTITYTFTFSQPVNGFAVDDVVVVGGTKAADVRLRCGRLLRLHPGDHAECGLPRQPHGQCCGWRCHRLGRQPEHRGGPVGAGRGHAGAVGCDHR